MVITNVFFPGVIFRQRKEFSYDGWFWYVHDDGLDATGDSVLADRDCCGHLAGGAGAEPEENANYAIHTTRKFISAV